MVFIMKKLLVHTPYYKKLKLGVFAYFPLLCSMSVLVVFDMMMVHLSHELLILIFLFINFFHNLEIVSIIIRSNPSF